MAREEYITSTGWRIQGSVKAPVSAPALEPGRDEDVLFTARVNLKVRLGTGSPVPVVLQTLHEAIVAQWPDAPPLTMDRHCERPAQRFHALRWTPARSKENFEGTLLWRHPHPESGGAPCTTHVKIAMHSTVCTLAVRITADHGWTSVRGVVGAGLARPAFLEILNERLRVSFAGRDCSAHDLTLMDMPGFTRNVLLSENRDIPVAVLSPLEDGGYAVDPDKLSAELLGLAHLFVMDQQQTSFALSDQLGDRRLSCYWGALRVYMPDFSCADRPDQHPLLQHDRLTDPLMRAGLIGNLSRIAQRWVHDFDVKIEPAPAHPARKSGVEASPPPVAQPATLADSESDPHRPVHETNFLQDVLSRLDARIEQMSAAIVTLSDTNRTLADELSRMRSSNLARGAGSNVVERRLQSIEQSVKSVAALVRESASESASTSASQASESPAPEASADEDTVSLVDIVRQASVAYPDTLLFLENAEASAGQSPYEDHERLAANLSIMSEVANRRRDGSLGSTLREAFREFGVAYRGGIAPSTSDRLRQQYVSYGPEGTMYECHEHLVLGSGYDPRHCLRIYFTSRAANETRFVIGHIGRHLNVKSTT